MTSGGFLVRKEYDASRDPIELVHSEHLIASVFYLHERFEVRLSFDNLTDEAYYLGADPYFGANAYITPAPGRQARLSVGYRF